MKGRGLGTTIAATLLAALPAVAPAAGADAPEDPGARPEAGTEAAADARTRHREAADSGGARLVERVTVTGARLPDLDTPLRDVPAMVTVITRERIERSGARTLQELLAREAGVALIDQIGNGLQQTLDLRGFSRGSGTAVFLDGARLNEPRNNTVALELVPVDAIERVEIVRGSTAALAGGGAEAGVIHVFTRTGEAPGAAIEAAAGTFDTARQSASAGARFGRFDLFVSGARDRTGGFRDNAAAAVRRLAATAGFDLGGDRRLSLSAVSTDARFGAPGALTGRELDLDPSASPFNRLDGSRGGLDQVSLNLRGPLAGGFSIAGNLFLREADEEILTTGRAAPLFGGFFLDSSTRVAGGTLQVSHLHRAGERENGLTFGLEALDGETRAVGFFTSPSDPAAPDLSNPDSDNLAERRTLAVFVQETWKPNEDWSLTAGARFDRDRVGYDESAPVAGLSGERRFSEVSLRAGATWNPHPAAGFYVSYGEAFLPPTVEQLFSFPGFGSNPDLDPQDSRTIEAGYRGRWGRGEREASVDLSLFRTGTDDEIVFDPDRTSGGNPFGTNVNAGRTLRRGIELSARGRPAGRLELFLDAALTEATFRGGEDAGKTVPLVPRLRASAGAEIGLPAGFSLRAEARHSGRQVLDNDEANRRERLGAWTVVDLRAAWSRATGGRPAGTLTLFAEGRNLFDERYETRGIFAFDFSTFTNAVFLTPAPGRRYLAGAEWRF